MKRLLASLFFLLATTLAAKAQCPADDLPAAAGPHAETANDSAADADGCSEPSAVEVPATYEATDASPLAPPAPALPPEASERFKWGAAVRQSFLFLAVQHTFRMTELKTRRELGGPFFAEWFDSVRSLRGWGDGGREFTNYVAHPMQGALSGYVQVQNDPKGVTCEFGRSKAYWKSRMKAMGWAAIWSTQFELGPISQAAIGNVGAGKFEARKMAYIDLVITPVVGTAWIVAEDAVDRHIVRWIERGTRNGFVRKIARTILNPARGCANALRFKPPWYRDNRP
jgi:hypothetical protein